MDHLYKTILCILLALSQISAQECNDLCTSNLPIHTANATDPNCGDFTPIKIDGCMSGATPENMLVYCGAEALPTVWFRIQIDTGAAILGTSLSTTGNWNPIWAIYYGDCDSLRICSNNKLNNPEFCSNDGQNDGLHVVSAVQGVQEYWVAVSGDGVINDPNFALNIWTSATCASCIGEDGCIPEASFIVASRSGDRQLDDPLFCEGEEVTVCFDFLYDASETGVDWLHGLIPNFGPGWDMDYFIPESVQVSPGTAQWFPEGMGACSPIITEQMPYLCTYNDPLTGKLKLCHTGCQACPCAGPLKQGASLPSGWFWNTNGGAGCDNDCSPSSHYGIGNVVININFCMNLKVRIFDTESDLIDYRSLQIVMQTTSDGVSGCWNDPIAECKLDFAQVGPDWNIAYEESTKIIAKDTTLFGQGLLDIAVSNDDNNQNLILIISPEDNPFVDGEMRDTFLAGSGIINDYLINTSSELQIVKYKIYVKNPIGICGNVFKIVKVLLYPADFTNEVKLKIFRDINNNELRDSAENPLNGFKITVPATNYSYFSNTAGEVSIFTNASSLPVTITSTYGNWDTSIVSLVIPIIDTFSYKEIGFAPFVDSSYKIQKWISSQFRCSTPSTTSLGIYNISPMRALNGKMVLIYDEKIVNTISVSNGGEHDQQAKRIEWAVDNVESGEALNASHNFVAPATMSNNDSLIFLMYFINEYGDTIIERRYGDLLRCSYDPNDKYVFPDRQGEENFILRDEELQYTIRFQNVGNDTAYNVVIVDNLDDRLDLNTMLVLYASHNVTTEAKGDTVYFKFLDINLPDSTRSPVESNGFILFTIKPKPDLEDGVEIFNTAYIYFDFNEPIITNTTRNTLVESLPCPQDAIWIEDDFIYVNPSLGTYNWYNCLGDSLYATTTDHTFIPSVNGNYYCIISGFFCESKTKCILYDKISSTSGYNLRHIKVYPNPGTDNISITTDISLKDIEIKNITDLNGRHFSVPIAHLEHQYTLNTSVLPSGIYIIHLRDGNGTVYKVKWVKL